ncbi:hypothetical protein F5I97DRAFT_1928420 [Phlebopus sp. FC_14]|nr:hypothetical protein F5I97DRAFT_1928420 [Phlebopus sp. FC_14]
MPNQRKLYVIQQDAGNDGLYHWKLFLATEGKTTSGVWHDVVWSPDKDVGMLHRGPISYSEAKSRNLLGIWEIGTIASSDAVQVDIICSTTRTPQYTVEDKDKNCQTWIFDVVGGLVQAGILDQSAFANLARVPRVE